MSGDITQFLEEQKQHILEEKRRLGITGISEFITKETCDNDSSKNNNITQSVDDDDKENDVQLNSNGVLATKNKQTLPFSEQVHLSSNGVILEEKKQAFINKLICSESPFTGRSNDNFDNSERRCAMLRYGEYSPNNPQLRVTTAPYLGVGEYEQKRNFFLQKQREEYLRYLAKKNEGLKEVSKNILSEKTNSKKEKPEVIEKSVQTDLKNIQSQIVQYDLRSSNSAEKELSPHPVSEEAANYCMPNCYRTDRYYRVDQRLTSAQNALLNQDMDKPKSILSNRRTGSPRARMMSDMYNQASSSFMDGFSYQTTRAEELERERLKRESYQRELRLQIEEKRRIQNLREEQERKEQEIENRRLEQQLLRMEEERLAEEQRRNRRDEQMRRHSEDILRRKQELQLRQSYRKHTDSESSATSCLRTDVASKPLLSHYSPPVSRRNPYSFNIPTTSVFSEPTMRYNPTRFDSCNQRNSLKRMESFNSYDLPTRRNVFSRFDSLSRIDSLTDRLETMSMKDSLSDGHRRHSATQQDLSAIRKSPRLQRRGSSSRFYDDPLPIPVLKTHSPVAKELKNSVPFNSSKQSEAVRRLEDRWQIPAVQKNVINYSEPTRESSQTRSILTQLGAIRMQLQQEQMRMDETLRKRGITQSKAVDFH